MKDLIQFAENKNISIQAKGLMLYFLAHANYDGSCDVTREQIMADMGIGKAMLNKYTKELERTINIKVYRREKERGRFLPNDYWVGWVIEE